MTLTYFEWEFDLAIITPNKLNEIVQRAVIIFSDEMTVFGRAKGSQISKDYRIWEYLISLEKCKFTEKRPVEYKRGHGVE